MLYNGSLITPNLNVLLIDDIKTESVIGPYIRQQGVVDQQAPDPYFTHTARRWDPAMQALRYPPPNKWHALFLDNHLEVDRHDDHLGVQICEWLRVNPYFLPKEIFLISFDGPSDKLMYDILSKVYTKTLKKNLHVYKSIVDLSL